MLPFLAAMIGAGGSIAGGLIGAGAQQEAADMNWQINLLNYYQRQQERRDRIREAQQTRADQRLGATDAFGNRTKFVEGKGWVTELSDQDQLLADLQRQEQLKTLQNDLPLRRAQLMRNDSRQREEEQIAEGLREKFRRDIGVDPEALKRTMMGNISQALNREYDSLENEAMRKAMRTGASNSGQILADLARDRIKTIASSIAGVPMQAYQMASDMSAKEQGNNANMYNMMATRAGQMPGVSYRPENVQGDANNLMKYFANMSMNGDNNVQKALAQPGGTLDYVRPNTGYGDAIAGGANALSAALERMYAANNRQNAMNTF